MYLSDKYYRYTSCQEHVIKPSSYIYNEMSTVNKFNMYLYRFMDRVNIKRTKNKKKTLNSFEYNLLCPNLFYLY